MSVFRNWPSYLTEDIEVAIVQLPGHGSRISELPYRRIPEIVDAITPILLQEPSRSFALFGYSLGALIAFEVARSLPKQDICDPKILLVGACNAAHLLPDQPPVHDLPELQFISELKLLNGSPKELFEHDDLLSLFMPILRADFAAYDHYEFREKDALCCPITTISGLDDVFTTYTRVGAWQRHTNRAFSMEWLPGDHFYIHAEQERLLRIVSERLSAFI